LYDRTDNIAIATSTVSVPVDQQSNIIFDWNTAPASISDHTLEAEVVADDDRNPSNDRNSSRIEITARPDLSMRVESIDITVEHRTQGKDRIFIGKAVVIIQDSNGNPVEEARLSGEWSGAANAAASTITNASGIAVIRSAAVKNISPLTPFIFTVKNVEKGAIPYNPSENAETSDTGRMQ
jgi:hypothetical protein